MATIRPSINGLNQVITNIRKVGIRVDATIPAGLFAAGEFLKTESQKLVPVEYGELRDSAFVVARRRGFYNEVTVGYSAPYAIYVHENMQMKLKGKPRPSGKGNYWDPNGRPKFLEEPSRRLQKELFALVANKVEIQ